MTKNREREDFEGREEEMDEDFEGGEDELGDDEFGEEGPVEIDSDEVLDDPDFEEDSDEEVVAARPTKRRPVVKKVPTIEGVPKTKLDKADVAAEVWEKMKARQGEGSAVPYKISSIFKQTDVVDHKAFGIGFVLEVPSPLKVEVLFADGLKRLVHGR